MQVDRSDGELLRNLAILGAKLVYFVVTFLRSIVLIWITFCVLYVSYQDNQSDLLIVAVICYIAGRWHQARITKQRSNSNNSLRKSA